MTNDINGNESEKQFNQNETDSHPPRSINSKTKAPATVMLVVSIAKSVRDNAIRNQ